MAVAMLNFNEEQQSYEAQRTRILDVAWMADGTSLVSASEDGVVQIWSTGGEGKWKPVRTLGNLFDQLEQPRCIALSPDDRWLAIGLASGQIRVFDLRSGSSVTTLSPNRAETTPVAVNSIAFNPDPAAFGPKSGKTYHLAAGEENGTLRVWRIGDGSQGTPTGNLDCSTETGSPVIAVAYQPPSGDEPEPNRIAAGCRDGRVGVWRLDTATGPTPADDGLALLEKEFERLKLHGSAVRELAFSPRRARHLVSVGSDGRLFLLDLRARTATQAPADGLGALRSVAVSADGSRLACAGVDRLIWCWEFDGSETLSSPRTFEGHGGIVYALAFSPDSRLLLSGSADETVRIWSVTR